jgi:23S rRNA pseudouridine2605 synthase
MIRIQKFLSEQGIASRRTIETWIKENRISINNNIAKLGDKININNNNQIKLDNKILKFNNLSIIKPIILLYHKPQGQICTRSDPKNRPSVFQNLPKLENGRWVAIGRLDLYTSGILLFTNNGETANQLMHPKYNQEREYLVRIFGIANQETLLKLTNGIKLKPENTICRFKTINLISQKSNSWYKVILTEGRNREIKRLFSAVGLEVNRLIRTRFGNFVLPKFLKPGEYYLTENINL